MKKQIKLKVDKDKSIDIFVDKKSKNPKIVEMIKKGAEVAFNYFDNVKKINFSIELIYSRAEFDEKVGFKTENWFIANSFKKKFIIFSPDRIEDQTSHKKNEFVPIISHETSHILLNKINMDFCAWLSEGIAQNIAKQERKGEIKYENQKYFLKDSLFKNSDCQKFISRQGYNISYKLVRFLIENYSKKQVMDLLKIKYYDYENSLEKDFCKILKTSKKNLLGRFKKILKSTR